MKPNHELDFLPAALEIQEKPASPVGRAIIWAIVAFFSLAVVWAMVGEIDIVATAQGKIIPSGRVKVIQPMEIGVVRRIHVQEGQQVAAGDLLIGPSTGPLHIAAALGIPTVAIFGSTDLVTTGPKGPKTRIIKRDTECAPCLKQECPTDHRCMLRIDPEDVWHEMNILKGERLL